MLTLLALHFAKIAKRIRVAGIYYGNYEAGRVTAGSEAKTPDTPMPIVDLTAFSELQDWITNVYALLETGRAEPLSRWIEEKSAADSNAGADVHKPIRDLARRWQNLTDSLQTARSFFFQERAFEAMESIGKVEDEPVYYAFRPMTTLLRQVEEQIRPMVDSDPVRSGVGAIEWCYNHGLVQQTYTLIIELVISTVCWVEGREVRNQNHRNDAAGWLSKAVKQFAPSALHHGSEAGGPKEPKPSGEKEKAALRRLQQFPGLLDSYAQFNNLRNDLNHGAARRNPHPPEVFSQVFAANWPKLKENLLHYWDSFSVGSAARTDEQ